MVVGEVTAAAEVVTLTWLLLMRETFARWQKAKDAALREAGPRSFARSVAVPGCPTCGHVPTHVTFQDCGIDWTASWGWHRYIIPLRVIEAAA